MFRYATMCFPERLRHSFLQLHSSQGQGQKNRTSADVRAYLNRIRNCILIQLLFVSKSYFILYCIRYCIQPLSSLTGVAVSFPGRNRGHFPRNRAQISPELRSVFSGTAFTSPELRSVFSGTAFTSLELHLRSVRPGAAGGICPAEHRDQDQGNDDRRGRDNHGYRYAGARDEKLVCPEHFNKEAPRPVSFQVQ